MQVAKTNAKEWTVESTTCDTLKFVQEYSVIEKSEESSGVETNLDKLKVKKRLQASWNGMQKDYTTEGEFIIVKLINSDCQGSMSGLQSSLFKHINEYQDVLFTHQDFDNSNQLRQLYCMHAINHVYK